MSHEMNSSTKPMMRLNITSELEVGKDNKFPWGQPVPIGWTFDSLRPSEWLFFSPTNFALSVSVRVYQAGCSRWIDMNIVKYKSSITLDDLFSIKKAFVGSRPASLTLSRNANDCAHAARLTASFDASAELALLDMHDEKVNAEEFHSLGENDE